MQALEGGLPVACITALRMLDGFSEPKQPYVHLLQGLRDAHPEMLKELRGSKETEIIKALDKLMGL